LVSERAGSSPSSPTKRVRGKPLDLAAPRGGRR
jgi:hypothetical protein